MIYDDEYEGIVEQTVAETVSSNFHIKRVDKGANVVRVVIDICDAKYDDYAKLENKLRERFDKEDIKVWLPLPGEEFVGIDIPKMRRHGIKSEPGWTMDDFRNVLPLPASIGKDMRGDFVVCNLRDVSPMLIIGGEREERNVFADEIAHQIQHHPKTECCHIVELEGRDICAKLRDRLAEDWNEQNAANWSGLIVILKDVVVDQELAGMLYKKHTILDGMKSREVFELINRTYFIVAAKNSKDLDEELWPRTLVEFKTRQNDFLGWREFLYRDNHGCTIRVQGFTPPKRKFTSKDDHDLQKYIHSPHATVKGYLALLDRYNAETTLACTDCTLVAANADYIKRRMLIRTVKALACKYHKGQFRKGSEKVPYIKHPGSVVAKLKEWGVLEEELSLAVAWGHDLFEDTKITEEDMIKVFPEDPAMMERVISDIKQITFYPPKNASNQEYDEAKRKYIKDIAANAPEDVLLVKIADRLCNSLDFLKFSDKKAWEYIREGQPLFDNVERLSECYREEVKAEIAATFKQIDEEVARQDAYERMHDSMDWAGEE